MQWNPPPRPKPTTPPRRSAGDRMRVAVTGASGLIGTALCRSLEARGDTVVRLSRAYNATALDGADAVVHLAGASISERWSDAHKRVILDSRVQGTTRIAQAIAQLDRKPRVLVSSSAVGWYGDRGDEILDETSGPGRGFLADVCRAWEASADAARAAGIRVVHPRTGVVLSPLGGMLGKLLPMFRLGAGGRIGSGAQWTSWVALTDVVAAFEFMIATETLSGPVNLVGPTPVTNAGFTRALGDVLHRPTIATVPPFALRLAFGAEMTAELFLAGQRAVPRALERSGFGFRFPALESALRFELGVAT